MKSYITLALTSAAYATPFFPISHSSHGYGEPGESASAAPPLTPPAVSVSAVPSFSLSILPPPAVPGIPAKGSSALLPGTTPPCDTGLPSEAPKISIKPSITAIVPKPTTSVQTPEETDVDTETDCESETPTWKSTVPTIGISVVVTTKTGVINVTTHSLTSVTKTATPTATTSTLQQFTGNAAATAGAAWNAALGVAGFLGLALV